MRITKFEEFIEKSVPYFIAVVFLIILLVMGSCATYPNQKSVITPRSEAKANFR